jgi:hypothetical protein
VADGVGEPLMSAEQTDTLEGAIERAGLLEDRLGWRLLDQHGFVGCEGNRGAEMDEEYRP